jgi:predicted flap endonuclease-1-like 5' DNA nuclease
MRTVYLLILLFLVACIVSAEVYINQTRSIGFFRAPTISRALWIIELLVMLLIACLIGFAIAWQLRQEVISKHKAEKDQLIYDVGSLTTQLDRIRDELTQKQNRARFLLESHQKEIRKLSNEKERLKEEFISIQAYIEELKNEKSQLKRKTEQLERNLQFSQDNVLSLKSNLENAKFTKSFALPPKDDLKLIHGIGPALEKKLNALGIYSFRQISEFTHRTISEITEAIKFFPGRIERDNWVSQARNFEEEKKRQA